MVATDRSRLSWAGFGGLALLGLVFVVWKGRGNAFFFDDWSWIEFRRTGLHAMLASYNQHLVIAPVAAYQLLFTTVGLAHYWPYRLLARRRASRVRDRGVRVRAAPDRQRCAAARRADRVSRGRLGVRA